MGGGQRGEYPDLKAHEQSVTFLAWSPLEERLVSAGMDGRARVWNVARDTMVLSLPYGWAYCRMVSGWRAHCSWDITGILDIPLT
jgi:WD40 repeat protein